MRVARSLGLQLMSWIGTLALCACSAWQPFADTAVATRPDRLPYALRVTRTDGSRTTLLAPFIRGDSLHGRVLRDTLSMPLSEVQRLEQDRFSVTRTVVVVLAVPMVFVAAYAIRCGDNRCGAQIPEGPGMRE